MKAEEFLKIQLELELLKAGVYDDEIVKLINTNKKAGDKYKKDFSIIEKTGPHSYTTNPRPEQKYLRIWWFRNYKHPELFK